MRQVLLRLQEYAMKLFYMLVISVRNHIRIDLMYVKVLFGQFKVRFFFHQYHLLL